MMISVAKYFLLILVVCSGSLSAQTPLNQTDAQGRRQGEWQKKYPNGNLMYRGRFENGKPAGEWKRYHEEGGLKAILLYSGNSDTVKASLYETSSHPVAKGNYLHEKKEGLWTYFSDGTRIAEEQFVRGKKNGLCHKYYPSGEILESSEWKDDKLEGKYRAFYPSGKPYLECFYSHNQRNGRCFSYFPSGFTEVESTYLDNLPDGPWKCFDEEGKLRFTLVYEKGTLKNPEVLLSLNSQELENLEKQRSRLVDPEKYLQNPEEYPERKR